MHPDSIERYLAKRMNPEELKKFEFKMNEDSKLKQEVMELQNAIDAIKVHERSELKNRLVAREKQFEIKNSLRPFKFGIWYIFIGIIILISLCFLIKVDDKALIKNNGLSERIDSLKKIYSRNNN